MAGQIVLPRGKSAAGFERALKRYAAIVGDAYVITDQERLLPYRKIMLPTDPDAYASSGVISPASVEEIQAILAVCREERIAVWPISTGRNFGYGSACPAERGTLMLDLKRMNKILDVDPEMCTALIEPGVTYKQLQDYLQERNIPLWLDFPGPGPIVSPLSNTLERGQGYTPYGDHFAQACGMEVVLADGQILRTGMGSLPNSTSWQVFKYGYGPYLDGIFTQSNFGIVTKMGMWLMPAPESYKCVMVQYDSDDDLEVAVETLRPLKLNNIIQNVASIANSAIVMTSFKTRADFPSSPAAVPEALIQAAAKEVGIAPWNVIFSLYGSEAQIAPNYDIVKTAFERSGGRLVPGFHDKLQVNELTLDSFRLLNWRPGGGLWWFSPVSPTRGKEARDQKNLAVSILSEFGFEYMAGITVAGRDMHNVTPVVFNNNDPDERARGKACMDKLITESAKRGYGIYRAGITNMDQVAACYGDTNLEVNRAIKRALDPHGILAPGKSGIRI